MSELRVMILKQIRTHTALRGSAHWEWCEKLNSRGGTFRFVYDNANVA